MQQGALTPDYVTVGLVNGRRLCDDAVKRWARGMGIDEVMKFREVLIPRIHHFYPRRR